MSQKKRLLRTLGLSMLVASAMLAVSASGAQAKWLIKVGGKSVASANLIGTFDLGEMLVPGMIAIHCIGATGNAKIETGEEDTILLLSGSTHFTGCLLKDSTGKVNKNCTVNSPGKGAGSISASGGGESEMEGSTTFSVLESEAFTEIVVSGALCPLAVEWLVRGTTTLTLDNGEELKAHAVGLDEQELFFVSLTGGALLHSGSNPSSPIMASVEEESGNAWAIQLVGLED